MTIEFLEIGGGSNPRYHPNVDIRKVPGVDIVANLEEPLPLKDGEYTHVYSAYAVEHVSWRKLRQLIQEIYRVCADKGDILLVVPNTMEQCKKIASRGVWQEGDSELLFGSQDYDENSHKCGFSPAYLTKLLESVGFANVTIKPHPNCTTDMVVTAVKRPFMPAAVGVGSLVTPPAVLPTTKAPSNIHPILMAVRRSRGQPSRKLNIALISSPMIDTPPKAYGGLERVVADLGYQLHLRGHDVTIFATDNSAVEGCKIVKCGVAANTTKTNWIEAEQRMYEVYKDKLKGFDIIHGHNWFGYEYKAKALDSTLKVMHTHHGGMDPGWWARRPPPFRLNIAGISEWMTKIYGSIGIPSKAVWNGVNLERYPFFDAPRDRRLAWVGRLDVNKRPDVAITAANLSGMPLDIVGGSFVYDDEYIQSIRKKATRIVDKYPIDMDSIGTQDGITLYLDAPHEVKVKVYQHAAATLFTSCMGEPFGLVPVESMACGTPVVAFNDGAVEEVVRIGGVVLPVFKKSIHNGGMSYDVVAPSVDDQLKAGIIRALEIPRKDALANAQFFSADSMAADYEALYIDILEGREW